MYDIFHAFGENKAGYTIWILCKQTIHMRYQVIFSVLKQWQDQLQNFSGIFRAIIVFCGTKMEQQTHDKSFHKTEFLILSHISICS